MIGACQPDPPPRHLVRYQKACRAVAKSITVDEEQEIVPTQRRCGIAPGRPRNRQLELYAAEIRIRAERRVGELMAAQKDAVGTATPQGANQHRDRVATKPDAPPTLAEAGIDKNL